MTDLEKGRITMTDESAFVLGENIGVSGDRLSSVILFELIQYHRQRPFINSLY